MSEENRTPEVENTTATAEASPLFDNQPAAAPEAANSNGTVVLVLGIISVVFAFVFNIVGLITGIIGLVLGNKAKKATPTGTAKAGFVLSIIGLILSAIFLIVGIVAAAALVSAFGGLY